MDTTFRSEQRFTQSQFATWLDKYGGTLTGTVELIEGTIVMAPPATYPHSRLITRLINALENHARADGLGEVHAPSAGYEFRTGDTLEPDVSFLSTERIRQGPAPRVGEFMRMVPDLVIEVLSPSNERYDRTKKKQIYASNGVDEYWLVAPRTRSVTVFRRSQDTYDEGVTYVCGEVASHVLPRLGLTVEDLFADIA